MKIKIMLAFILALPLTGLIPETLGVDEFKVSEYGAGHQIWFEAENYTSRTPDTNEHWVVEEIKNAYEKTVLGPTGKFGGMLRYEFDIRAIGPKAKGGVWYMWARLVNPGNQSDYMLVEGHPRDKIPKKAPPDRGGFGNNQRVFEFNVGTAPNTFGWGPANHKEGHTKELQNGKISQFSFEDKLVQAIKWTSSCGPMMEHINQPMRTTKKQNREDSQWIKSINFPHFGE